MALSTKNLPTATAGLSKTIKPGNRLAKLNGLALEADRFKEGAYHLNLSLEGPDLGDEFEGFFIDNEDHSKGRHKGQVGVVRAGAFSFSDGEVNGRVISRDEEILKFLATMGRNLGKSAELDNIKAETIEEYVPLAAKVLCGTETFLHYCIGGKEYESKGYTNYNLFLVKPDFKAKRYPVAADEENLVKYDAEKHIQKKKEKAPVEEFAPAADLPDEQPFDL
jgi:hypothetical protein